MPAQRARTEKPARAWDLCLSDLEKFTAGPPGNAWNEWSVDDEQGHLQYFFHARGTAEQVRAALMGKKVADCDLPEDFQAHTKIWTVTKLHMH